MATNKVKIAAAIKGEAIKAVKNKAFLIFVFMALYVLVVSVPFVVQQR